MNIFWAHEPLFIRDLISYMPEPRPHYNTVATLVKFLEEKGFVEREPMANSFRYKVKITKRQYHGDTVSEVVAPSTLISTPDGKSVSVNTAMWSTTAAVLSGVGLFPTYMDKVLPSLV